VKLTEKAINQEIAKSKKNNEEEKYTVSVRPFFKEMNITILFTKIIRRSFSWNSIESLGKW
jgi:phage tail sheath gpL-like